MSEDPPKLATRAGGVPTSPPAAPPVVTPETPRAITGIAEIFEDVAGEFRFRIKGLNGEIVASSEGYTRKADAARGLHTLITLLSGDLDIRDQTP